MTKDFKFSIKTKSGKVLHESVVTFGGEKNPFPKNWKEDYWVQRGIQETKEQIFRENFSIEVSEDLTFTIEDNHVEKDKLRFSIKQLEILKSKYESLGIYRGTIKEYIDIQIYELEQKLNKL